MRITDILIESKKTLKNSNPCWKGYHPVGTKKKGGKTVPNCVPEAANPAQQAAIAVNMKKQGKKPKNEAFDDAEYNDESGMAQNSLHTIHRAAVGLSKLIKDGENLPEWVQEKLSIAEDYMQTVWDYLES